MTLIESDDGKLRMYEDDPSQEAPECESPVGCWFNWVQLVAGVAVIAPRNITDGAAAARAAIPGRVTRPCAMLEQCFSAAAKKSTG